MNKTLLFSGIIVVLLVAGVAWYGQDVRDMQRCSQVAREGFRSIADQRDQRFLGKVQSNTAECRGGDRVEDFRSTPWVDWSNYWGTGDESSKSSFDYFFLKRLGPNARGIDGALLDLEYQRIELVKFNLFDNYTYESYVRGQLGVPGRAVRVWPEMKLPASHPRFADVGGAGEQVCSGDLVRFRTLTGICNDVRNPRMGSSNTAFARNVAFETTYPDLGLNDLTRNRHRDRLSLLVPDPQVISRKLFTRPQSDPSLCNDGLGLPGHSPDANCDYQKAPFFNVLAAFWIQFMTHDWFSHMVEGENTREMMDVGCSTRIGADGKPVPLTAAEIAEIGCRPADRMERAMIADDSPPPTFAHGGKTQLARAHKTTNNTNTAWWDASQIYGYDDTSRRRVKRDPDDRARLLMVSKGSHSGAGERQGYLPSFAGGDPIHTAWAGQEATAFPDNWTIGMSFYHNVFVREHNAFVDAFRAQAAATPGDDSGLRNPAAPDKVIAYGDVTEDELFEVGRLVVSAEIAKIHTIEWTTQLLYDEVLYEGMNANWHGLIRNENLVNRTIREIIRHLQESTGEDASTMWYSVFASGSGIVGLGSTDPDYDITNPTDLNGGVNHFGSPFNFPEEFVTVYRLHPLVPDLLEYREWNNDPNVVRKKIPAVETFRGKATSAMQDGGLANWALTMGRQRLGALTLQNHPTFLQNLPMPRLGTETNKLDVAALDLIRDRERGVPRFNEFRRQYGLKQLTSFDDFVDKRLPADSPTRRYQEDLAGQLREVYGTHRCDASLVITAAQLNDDGSQITDCLGHPDGTMVDNVEDLDTVVGWLAESTRPHGFAISETQFQVFIINASRRLFSDRFFTSSYRPEFYTHMGIAWVDDNGPDGKVYERGRPNGHRDEVSPLKRVLLRTVPELEPELREVVNIFDPWARDRGDYYSLAWVPREDARSDSAFDE